MKKTIFYHDTDCGNVVYYANYLKYFEEARTLYMAEKGFSVPTLIERGLYFVVARQEVEYKYSVRYADEIASIKTECPPLWERTLKQP